MKEHLPGTPGSHFVYGCFNWMMKQIFSNGKVVVYHFHPLKTGFSAFQVDLNRSGHALNIVTVESEI